MTLLRKNSFRHEQMKNLHDKISFLLSNDLDKNSRALLNERIFLGNYVPFYVSWSYRVTVLVFVAVNILLRFVLGSFESYGKLHQKFFIALFKNL